MFFFDTKYYWLLVSKRVVYRRKISMKYKKLGNSGLLVSELSFGTWVSFYI